MLELEKNNESWTVGDLEVFRADTTMDKDIIMKNWQLIENYIKSKYSGIFTKDIEISCRSILLGITTLGKTYVGDLNAGIIIGKGYENRVNKLKRIIEIDLMPCYHHKATTNLTKLTQNNIHSDEFKMQIYEFIIRHWDEYNRKLATEAYYYCNFDPNDIEYI